MEIKIADSFFDSLKVIKRHNTWWYKTYDLFVYRIPYFFKNIHRFRKELWSHRWWDYSFTLMMLSKSLEIQREGMRTKGHEIEESLNKKLEKMQRAIEILNNREEVKYIEIAEKQLGSLHDWDIFEEHDNLTEEQRDHNRKVYTLAKEIQSKEWKELWTILEGQNYEEYDPKVHGDFYEWYDGTGILDWWD